MCLNVGCIPSNALLPTAQIVNEAAEMGADAKDLGLTIHPHPTPSEMVNFAVEVAEGTVTALYVLRKK